jgi:hypothetical protein
MIGGEVQLDSEPEELSLSSNEDLVCSGTSLFQSPITYSNTHPLQLLNQCKLALFPAWKSY